MVVLKGFVELSWGLVATFRAIVIKTLVELGKSFCGVMLSAIATESCRVRQTGL